MAPVQIYFFFKFHSYFVHEYLIYLVKCSLFLFDLAHK